MIRGRYKPGGPRVQRADAARNTFVVARHGLDLVRDMVLAQACHEQARQLRTYGCIWLRRMGGNGLGGDAQHAEPPTTLLSTGNRAPYHKRRCLWPSHSP